MTVLILYGGRSTEHEVSLVSAAGVLQELSRLPDMKVIPAGITRDGRWFLQDCDQQQARARETGRLSIDTERDRSIVVVPGRGLAGAGGVDIPVDCVFPILHGSYGEDGTIQGLFEIASLPYVGSGVTGSAVGMDKLRTKQLWQKNGLPVVPYTTVDDRLAGDSPTDERAAAERFVSEAAQRVETHLGYPVFVKPNAAGSSIGITRVADRATLGTALNRALAVDRTVLIEQALPVREIETSVLGNETPITFPPGEVIPTHEFYDYDAKYTDPDGARLVVPADLPDEIQERIRSASARAFQAVDAAGLARVDSFLHKSTGEIYLNEINTIPGFTPISMYPKMVENGGMPYGELLQTLLALAIERDALRKKRDYHAR